MLLRIESMLDAAPANIILQVEDVVQSRHQIADILGRGPTLLMQLLTIQSSTSAELFI